MNPRRLSGVGKWTGIEEDWPMRIAAFGVLGVLTASAPVASFSDIADQGERSRALFHEIAKVITHPRCMNCHPAEDRPLQGDDRHEHLPPVPRGEAGLGVPGLACSSCHTERNFTLVGVGTSYKSIPGHPRWQLAPVEMA